MTWHLYSWKRKDFFNLWLYGTGDMVKDTFMLWLYGIGHMVKDTFMLWLYGIRL